MKIAHLMEVIENANDGIYIYKENLIMRTPIIILLFLLISSLFAVGQNGMTCIQSDPSGLEIDFAIPQWDLRDSPDGDGLLIQSSNVAWIADEGKPQLPIFSTSVAIPDQGTFSYEVEILEEEIVNDVQIAPWHEPSSDAASSQDTSIYGQDTFYPSSIVQMSDPAIMRDYRIASISVTPFHYNDAMKQLRIIRSFRLHVTFNSDRSGINEITNRSRNASKSFTSLYANALLNYEQVAMRTMDDPPCILYIYYNNATIASYIALLANWKHQVGYEVHMATTAQTGTTNSSIKAYIQNAYDNWENPPDYVVMVGDATGTYGLPTWYQSWESYNAEGDHPYTLLAGDDQVEDICIGRLSFSSLDELLVIISKNGTYESSPYTDDTDWYDQVLLVGDTSPSGISCISTNNYVKERMLDYSPDYTFTELYGSSPSPQSMNNAIDAGVSYFNYRGYLYMSDWDHDNYVFELTNYHMLPVCVIITCGTGSFASETSATEQLLRLGTTTNPRGGVCAIGSATWGTHTAYNNALDASIFSGLFNHDLRTIGEAMQFGKFSLWEIYNNSQFETMRFFLHNNNLMGDPTLQVWKTVPQTLNAAYSSSIAPGTDQIQIRVTQESGSALSNAWVTILKDSDTVFATGYTDNNGYVYLPVETTSTGNVTVTVTKAGYKPHQGTFTIASQTHSVTVDGTIIDDDNTGTSSGNGNGIVNAGETIELKVNLRNNGSSSLNNVIATLTTSSSMVESISDNYETWGTIASGAVGTCADDFDFTVEADCPDGYEIPFVLSVQSGLVNWRKELTIQVSASNLYVGDITIDDEGGNGNLDPTETGDIYLELVNSGSVSLTNVNATVSVVQGGLSFSTSTTSFGTVSAGGSATNTVPLVATATEDVIPGTQFSIKLALTADGGYVNSISFPLTVGTVSSSDPLGPDAYGYYIYDSDDTIYSLVPVYDWIEIDPSYGGSGTSLGLTDTGNNADDVTTVNIPINFVYYGEHYSSISVCSNGWISCGATEQITFRNYRLPGPLGPTNMIAPFWDDLALGTSSDVLTYYNSTEHYYVVEWSHMSNRYNGATETFQAILYDASFHNTPTGDSPIKFQYNVFNNVDQGGSHTHGEYCTIGIENGDETIGLEYTFNNEYPDACHTLSNGMALYITTGQGEIQGPPSASVYPSQIDLYVMPGETTENQISISNTGEADLFYSIYANYLESRDYGEDGTFGYEWIDSSEPAGPVYDWVDISDVGTEINFTGDDVMSSSVSIGFDFPFYESTYSSVQVCSNGFLSFDGSGASQWTNISIPTTDNPNNFIAPFYDDLSPQNSGNTYYYHDSALGRFIVSFEMVPHYGSTYPGTYSFQAILYENGTIIFQYDYLQGTITSATIGIENANGTDGLLIAFNESYAEEGLAIKISTGLSWLEVSPESGLVEQDGSQTISLTANAEDLELGTYECELLITTNDPAHNPIIVPVTLHVVTAYADPSAVTGLSINSTPGICNLSWEPVTTDINGSPITVSYYNIYRSDIGVEPAVDGAFFLASTSNTSYADAMTGAAGYRYIVTAVLDDGRETRAIRSAKKEINEQKGRE